MEKKCFKDEGKRQVSYYVCGAPDGFPVVCMHGAPGCGLDFKCLDEKAKKADFLLLCPNRPGYDDTDLYEEVEDILITILDDVEYMLSDYGISQDSKIAVMGVSMGGLYSYALTHEFPKRVLCAMCVAGCGELSEQFVVHDLNWFEYIILSVYQSGFEFCSYILFSLIWGIPYLLYKPAKSTFNGFWYDCIIYYGGNWEFDSEEITRPMLLMHGDEDNLVPVSQTFHMSRIIKSSKRKIIHGKNHLDLCGPDLPYCFEQAIDFIKPFLNRVNTSIRKKED